jgi:hypothetical protein
LNNGLYGHQPTENTPTLRRGEGGWERLGGPLWTQSGGLCGPRAGWTGPKTQIAPKRLLLIPAVLWHQQHADVKHIFFLTVLV